MLPLEALRKAHSAVFSKQSRATDVSCATSLAVEREECAPMLHLIASRRLVKCNKN